MKNKQHTGGFTLIEVLVAAGIIVIIMGVLLGMTDQTQRLVRATSSKVEQFQEARVAFESMTRRLSQATLNTFWDYQYNSSGQPSGYQRTAELRFRSGTMKDMNPSGGPAGSVQPGHAVFFQAPIGMVDDTTNLGAMDHLMNSWGYFLEVGSDADKFPSFLKTVVNPRKRYRLMEFMEPSERLSVYRYQNDTLNRNWFIQSLAKTNRPVRVLAENIVALVIMPRLSLADERHINDSKHVSLSTQVVLPPSTKASYSFDSMKDLSTDAVWSGLTDVEKALLNPISQLPPVVQVVMVAIDEPSARRLEDLQGSNPYLGISTNPDPKSKQNLFTDPKALNDSATGKGDITRFQELLSSQTNPNIRASYRVFSSNVTIKGAKWSMHTGQ